MMMKWDEMTKHPRINVHIRNKHPPTPAMVVKKSNPWPICANRDVWAFLSHLPIHPHNPLVPPYLFIEVHGAHDLMIVSEHLLHTLSHAITTLHICSAYGSFLWLPHASYTWYCVLLSLFLSTFFKQTKFLHQHPHQYALASIWMATSFPCGHWYLRIPSSPWEGRSAACSHLQDMGSFVRWLPFPPHLSQHNHACSLAFPHYYHYSYYHNYKNITLLFLSTHIDVSSCFSFLYPPPAHTSAPISCPYCIALRDFVDQRCAYAPQLFAPVFLFHTHTTPAHFTYEIFITTIIYRCN